MNNSNLRLAAAEEAKKVDATQAEIDQLLQDLCIRHQEVVKLAERLVDIPEEKRSIDDLLLLFGLMSVEQRMRKVLIEAVLFGSIK